MKYPNSLRILICICFTSIFLTSACSSSDSGVTIKVLPTSLGVELPRYGLNLGGTGTYGAEQLRSNIVANPGFESILDRAIVIVDQVGPRSFTDDTNWLARTKGFGREEVLISEVEYWLDDRARSSIQQESQKMVLINFLPIQQF